MTENDVGRLATTVADLQTALNRADRAMADELGVGAAEDLQVLRLLLTDGPLRVGQLARRRWSSIATASARLDRLEKRGLLVRERMPDDRRAVVARLTTSGRRAATESSRLRLAALSPMATGFPTDELRRLIDALNRHQSPPASFSGSDKTSLEIDHNRAARVLHWKASRFP